MENHSNSDYPAFGFFIVDRATEYPERDANTAEEWANVITNITGKTNHSKWKTCYQWKNTTSLRFIPGKQQINRNSSKPAPVCTENEGVSVTMSVDKETKSTDFKVKTGESSSHVQEEVTLCVIDDARKRQDSFLCPREMLLREMPYFEKFMDSEQDVEVQFSVHCDIEVFKRLLLYASKDGDERKRLLIEPKYAIHMLVSAEFLQMESLIEECIKFCHKHMNLLLSMSGIIGLLGEPLLHRLAVQFTPDEVESLDDKHDKIKSKLFRKLAENLLNTVSFGPYSSPLVKCCLCSKVFSKKILKYVRCLPVRMTINKYGELYPDHKWENGWDTSGFLQNLHTKLDSWKLVYWRVWGTVHTLSCVTCTEIFPCSELMLCRHHPETPKFSVESGQKMSSHSLGEFPCCGRKTFRFNLLDPLQMANGCSFKMHSVNQVDKLSEVYTVAIGHKEWICTVDPPAVDEPPDLRTLCKWSEDRISRPPPRSSPQIYRSGGAIYRNETPERNLQQQRLLPGRDGSISHNPERFSNDKMLWNPSNSVWHNQDTLREYDSKYLDALMMHSPKKG